MVNAEREQLMDFAGYRNYSYDCEQLFSQRWALLGESGFFLDPSIPGVLILSPWVIPWLLISWYVRSMMSQR